MDQTQLTAAIEQQERQALGYAQGELAQERADCLKAYLSQPYGNEQEGRSQVVTSDVADAIEGIIPGLVRVFTSGDEVAVFEPTGPEDEQAAKQETDAINYILTNQNRFVPILQTWLRDGLISKVGYVKALWDDSQSIEEETYRGLSEDELVYLLQDSEVEIIGQDIDETGYTIKVRQKKGTGQVRIYNCRPEEILVNADHDEVSLRNAQFVQHRTKMTISELRQMGYDIPDDIGDSYDNDLDEEWITRNQYDEWDNETNDPASRRVTFRESYIRIDYDGDGLTELRRVCMVGHTVLANEQCDSIPICAWTPLILPHQHVGRSLAEQVADIQKQKTAVLRAGLDSLYLSLNGRFAISEQVNLDDMLVSRPGGIVRLQGGALPGQGHIVPMVPPDVSGSAFGMLEYFDTVRETRTGITRYNQGLDANSLNKTATGVQAIMSAAQQRIELVARTFAEAGGLRDLMLLVHELMRKHATKPMIIRLRNQWVPIDPRSWKTRYDMTISVGLGTGNREQQMANISQILLAQQQAIQIGVATPENIYNALAKFTEAAGFKAPENFFTNPSTQPPKPPAPDPKMLEAQAKLQLEQAKLQADQQKSMADMQIKQAEAQQSMAIEQAKLELEAEKMKHQMALEQFKVQAAAELEREKMILQAQMEMEKANFTRETEMMVRDKPEKEESDGLSVAMQAIAAVLQQASQPKTVSVIRTQNGLEGQVQ